VSKKSVEGLIDRSKLFASLAKKHKLSTSKVQAVFETLIKGKSFTQQKATTVTVKQQVPAEVRTTKIKRVEVIKEVPVVTTRQVIKKVEVIKEVPVEVIREVKVIKEVPIEVIKEVVKQVTVKVPVVKIKEIIKKVPVIKVKEVVKKVPVVKKVVDTKEIDKLNAKIADLKKRLAEKPKTVEVIREVPVEIIKEVEVVKQIDFASLAKMMKGMKRVEVSKTVVGESTVRGEEKIVERRELKPGTKATKVTGKATKISKTAKPAKAEKTAKTAKAAKPAKATKPTKDKSTTKSTVKAKNGDDLTKIEGIGPKIAEILNNGGVSTFKELSKSKISNLKSLLEKAGPKFQMHDPSTWTEQAALAADGKWNKLKTLQDNLDGGKR